jgi:hypothetical protein
MQHKRKANTKPEQINPNKVEQAKVEHKPEQPYYLFAGVVEGEKVYGRPAVRYDIAEPWITRPEPLNVSDEPVLNNRGLYKRADGTVYQFDACNTAYECSHPFTDKDGKEHLAVYETADDVKACYMETD